MHMYQTFGIFVWQRAQEDRVNNAEYRGIGTDSQSQGEDGDCGEAGGSEHGPNCVPKVLQQCIHLARRLVCGSGTEACLVYGTGTVPLETAVLVFR